MAKYILSGTITHAPRRFEDSKPQSFDIKIVVDLGDTNQPPNQFQANFLYDLSEGIRENLGLKDFNKMIVKDCTISATV